MEASWKNASLMYASLMYASLMYASRFLVAAALVLGVAGCSEGNAPGEKEPPLPDLSGMKVVMVAAPTNFRDEELITPRDILANAEIDVVIASTRTGMCKGMLGAEVEATVSLDDINPDNFDGIIFIGGPGATVFFDDASAHALAVGFNDRNKLTAAICLAPVTLANAGVLREVPATVWASEKATLQQAGAQYTGRDIERYDTIVTASGPAAAQPFALEIIDILAAVKQRKPPSPKDTP